MPATLAQVDADAQGLVAVALHRLHLALAHLHRQAGALADLGSRIAGPQLAGLVQGLVDQMPELRRGVRETGGGQGRSAAGCGLDGGKGREDRGVRHGGGRDRSEPQAAPTGGPRRACRPSNL